MNAHKLTDNDADFTKNRMNGSKYITISWAFGILISILILGAGGWAATINVKVDDHLKRIPAIEETTRQVISRLDRIENKLDRALVRGYEPQ